MTIESIDNDLFRLSEYMYGYLVKACKELTEANAEKEKNEGDKFEILLANVDDAEKDMQWIMTDHECLGAIRALIRHMTIAPNKQMFLATELRNTWHKFLVEFYSMPDLKRMEIDE